LIADTIHSNLREADLAIRIGADEFVLLIDPVDSYESLTGSLSNSVKEGV
jgi:GGDEF domain-containing protein